MSMDGIALLSISMETMSEFSVVLVIVLDSSIVERGGSMDDVDIDDDDESVGLLSVLLLILLSMATVSESCVILAMVLDLVGVCFFEG